MTKEKTSKLDFIPISTLFDTKGFKRNFKLLMQENNSSKSVIGEIIYAELLSKANIGTKVTKENKKNAKRDRKEKPTAAQLCYFKENWVIEHGHEYGWMKAAKKEYKISYPTINKILKNL